MRQTFNLHLFCCSPWRQSINLTRMRHATPRANELVILPIIFHMYIDEITIATSAHTHTRRTSVMWCDWRVCVLCDRFSLFRTFERLTRLPTVWNICRWNSSVRWEKHVIVIRCWAAQIVSSILRDLVVGQMDITAYIDRVIGYDRFAIIRTPTQDRLIHFRPLVTAASNRELTELARRSLWWVCLSLARFTIWYVFVYLYLYLLGARSFSVNIYNTLWPWGKRNSVARFEKIESFKPPYIFFCCTFVHVRFWCRWRRREKNAEHILLQGRLEVNLVQWRNLETTENSAW